jgi:hypothetical protein
MTLTPIPREQLANTLDRFMAGLSEGFSRAVFQLIRATSADHAVGAEAEQHRLAALSFVRSFDMAIYPEETPCRFNWDGVALNSATEAYVTHLLQLLPRSALPKVPSRRCQGMAGRSPS